MPPSRARSPHSPFATAIVLCWWVLSPFASGVERVALVIGNDDYQHARKLNAAVGDSRAVAAALERLGFETTAITNAGLEGMVEAMERFKAGAAGAKAALVYYAGHGIESQGQNYLIPIDARLDKEIQLQTQTVNLSQLLDKLAHLNVPARMVILDCCRDNPLEGRDWLATRGVDGGGLAALAVQSLPAATLVVYAASPGKPALDRLSSQDAHSPFTQAFLETVPLPGVHSFEVFGRIEEIVLNRTGGRQSPRLFYNGSTLPFRNFSFAPSTATSEATSAAAMIPGGPPQPDFPSPAMPVMPQLPTSPSSATPEASPALPPRGYFNLDEIFDTGPYADHNVHSKTEILKRAQEKLKATGHYSGVPDGIPGPSTQKAVLSWQSGVGSAEVTGRLDHPTIQAIGLQGIPEVAPPKSTAPAAPGVRLKLYFFTADWCPPCTEMKRSVLADSSVRARLGEFDYIVIDVDDSKNRPLSDNYGVTGIPHFVITDHAGKPVATRVGGMDKSSFLRFLNQVGPGSPSSR